MFKEKNKNRIIGLSIGFSIMYMGYLKYKEKLRQSNINKCILDNQESMIDEIAYHEYVIEKLGNSIIKLKTKILKNGDEGI